MGSPAVLDFDALCRPISEENPAGQYLRTSSDLDKLWWDFSDKLEQERGKEKRGLLGEDTSKDSPPRWNDVVQVGQNIISNSSKDIWVAAGMIEALTRNNGFTGLRDGFRLIRELTERFGAGVFPPLDEEDAADTGIHTAFVRLDGIDASLPDAIRRVPIVDSPDGPQYSTFDHIRIFAGRGGDDTQASIEAAARSTPSHVFHNMIGDAAEAVEEITKLIAAADASCGTSPDGLSLAPSMSRVKDTIEDSLRRMRSLAGDEPASEEETVAETTAGGALGRPASASGEINSREDAYKVLEKLATYFSRTEPHSPVATALRELVSWRTLSFADLMIRLIEDEGARRELFRRTGVQPPQES